LLRKSISKLRKTDKLVFIGSFVNFNPGTFNSEEFYRRFFNLSSIEGFGHMSYLRIENIFFELKVEIWENGII